MRVTLIPRGLMSRDRYMAVGQDDAPDLLRIFHQIGHVGDHHVHPVHLAVGEAQAAVHHKDVVAVFVYGKILADLVQAAKRNDLQFIRFRFLLK